MRIRHGQIDRRAFTLIELVIVVLIMGILAGTAAPRYVDALANTRVDSAARRVAADLRMARDYAQKVSQAQTVDFDVSTDSYAMPTMPDVNRPATTYTVTLPKTPYPVDVTSANFEGVDAIQFDIYGRPNHSGSVVVRSGSKQRTVQVDKIGNVTIL
jgi:type IV fimbrial biogenesis protein FimT